MMITEIPKIGKEVFEKLWKLFSQTVLVCKEHGLIDFEVLAIDSIKVRANASYKQNKNKKGIEKEKRKIEEKLESLFKEATDGEESEAEKAALLPAICGSETRSGKRHNLVLADPAFSSMDNLEKLETESINALIPDQRMKVEERDELARGAYDRSKFTDNPESEIYVCPAGQYLNNSCS